MKIGSWKVTITALSLSLPSGVPVDAFGCTSLQERPQFPPMI